MYQIGEEDFWESGKRVEEAEGAIINSQFTIHNSQLTRHAPQTTHHSLVPNPPAP